MIGAELRQPVLDAAIADALCHFGGSLPLSPHPWLTDTQLRNADGMQEMRDAGWMTKQHITGTRRGV